jgi:hypothetical protein
MKALALALLLFSTACAHADIVNYCAEDGSGWITPDGEEWYLVHTFKDGEDQTEVIDQREFVYKMTEEGDNSVSFTYRGKLYEPCSMDNDAEEENE